MADNKRDPRRTPAVGDVIMSGDRRVRRTVDKIRGGRVIYNDGAGSKDCDVASWRRWCRDRSAKIVKRAP
jgi:hypothetical protein